MKLGKKIRQKIRIFELLPSEYSEIRILKNDRILQTLLVCQKLLQKHLKIKMASKNSAIWTFFDQVENEPKFAKCKFCGDKLSLGSENSKNQTTYNKLKKSSHQKSFRANNIKRVNYI